MKNRCYAFAVVIILSLSMLFFGGCKKKGNSFTNSIGMKFVWIRPGTFTMGSPASEEGRDTDEIQHKVTLTKGFYIQTTEVTQAQWETVLGKNPGYFQGDDYPMDRSSVSQNKVTYWE